MPRRLDQVKGTRLIERSMMWGILLIFLLTGVSLILFGAQTYESIGQDMESNFKIRTPMTYVATKVRQHDQVNSVEVKALEGASALVLKEEDENSSYETWIYVYEGQLMEAYIDTGAPLKLGDGMVLMEVQALDFKKEESKLTIEMRTDEGEAYTLYLRLRTKQGEVAYDTK